MAVAWDCAVEDISKAKKKKQHHDQFAKNPNFKVGERVFVYIPAAGQGNHTSLLRNFWDHSAS